LPDLLRQHPHEVVDVEMHRFDESYIEFLDLQIGLCLRGPEWTEVLQRRRNALAPFVGRDLLRGRLQVGNTVYSIEVDPQSKSVIHWEN
jgi:hypothetical protein